MNLDYITSNLPTLNLEYSYPALISLDYSTSDITAGSPWPVATFCAYAIAILFPLRNFAQKHSWGPFAAIRQTAKLAIYPLTFLFFLLVVVLPGFQSSSLELGHLKSQYFDLARSTAVVFIFSFLIVKAIEEKAVIKFKWRSLNKGPERRSSIDQLKNPIYSKYKPEKQHRSALKKGKIFVGLNQAQKPMLLEQSYVNKTHILVSGQTGAGKGLFICNIASQMIKLGNFVFFVDPKNDEFAARVLEKVATEANKPFFLIDLNSDKPSINPLQDISPKEFVELLTSGLRLVNTDSESDYYKVYQRTLVRQLSPLVEERQVSFGDLLESDVFQLPTKELEKASGLIEKIAELAELECTQTLDGINLESLSSSGGCVYIIGSTRNESIITLQRMLVTRVLQILEKRPRHGPQLPHANLFLDEFKYLAGKPTIDALGTIRDKGASLVIAHQSKNDLAGCVAGQSSEELYGTVSDNTGIKVFYAPQERKTAEYYASMTGEKTIAKETVTYTTSIFNRPVPKGETTYTSEREYRIDANTIQSLPAGVALLISNQAPALICSAPIQPKPTDVEPYSTNQYSPQIKNDALLRSEGD